MTAMSTEKDRKLNENTSLIVIAEACLGTYNIMCFVFSQRQFYIASMPYSTTFYKCIYYAEFPQDVMQMIIELQSDKRELLLNVVSWLSITQRTISADITSISIFLLYHCVSRTIELE